MTAPRPRRRFQPEPVETTTASNHTAGNKTLERDLSANDNTPNAKTAPRRFNPRPVETTTSSSRSKQEEDSSDSSSSEPSRPARRFTPKPVETSSKSSSKKGIDSTTGKSSRPARRFVPEPIETTSTKQGSSGSLEQQRRQDGKAPRRFAPDLVESYVNSTGRVGAAEQGELKKAPRKFAPQPVESTEHSNRKPRRFAVEAVETNERHSRDSAKREDGGKADTKPVAAAPKKAPRRFAVEMIETAKRSRKSGDVGPTVPHSDRTESTGSRSEDNKRRQQQPEGATSKHEFAPLTSSDSTPRIKPTLPQNADGESKFSSASLRSRNRERDHSFRVPTLDCIVSSESESEEDQAPSLTTSRSTRSSKADGAHRSTGDFDDPTRLRESVDDRFSGYLLELAARAAEKQLREQAMAAFPNSDFHEPVAHFMDRDDDDDDDGLDDRVATFEAHDEFIDRPGSFTPEDWERLEMQKYHEQMAATAEKKKNETKKRGAGRAHERDSNEDYEQRDHIKKNSWWKPVATLRAYGAYEGKDNELKKMRNAASPPMLGDDIQFPRCPSPEPDKFDPNDEYFTTDGAGLWSPQAECHPVNQRDEPPSPNNLSPFQQQHQPQQGAQSPTRENGLWGGFCSANKNKELEKGRTGLLTPRPEPGSRPGSGFFSPAPSRPSTPTGSRPPTPGLGPKHERLRPPPTAHPPRKQLSFNNKNTATIDAFLQQEEDIEREFPDSFVTQVFNYLSLGYPSIACAFDIELSKISRTSVAELRLDNNLAKGTTRGFILLGDEGEELQNHGIHEEQSARWKALRVYVREWARQQPRMEKERAKQRVRGADQPAPGFAVGQGAAVAKGLEMGAGIGPRRGSWAL